jgi:hypothetical protein
MIKLIVVSILILVVLALCAPQADAQEIQDAQETENQYWSPIYQVTGRIVYGLGLYGIRGWTFPDYDSNIMIVTLDREVFDANVYGAVCICWLEYVGEYHACTQAICRGGQMFLPTIIKPYTK